MAERQRKRRRRHRRAAGMWLTFFFVLAVGYIVFVLISNPDRILSGLFKNSEAAPAFAEAADNSEGALLTSDELTANEPAGMENPPEEVNNNPYARFSFYIAAHQAAYEAFSDLHPEHDVETITWMVNAGLDKPFFTDAAINTDPNPLLVNPYNRLPDDFIPTELVVIDDAGRQATPDTINAFRRMREGAISDGLDIAVQSAYRTIAYQQGLYDRAGGDGAVARPTYSEHHTGRALDLWGPDGLLDENAPTETGRWVAEHAYEYGFIIRYTEDNQPITSYIPEPWHITYVGESIASAMRDEGVGSLEEYVARHPEVTLYPALP